MGLINPDVIVLRSGSQLSNCFVTFCPGPTTFPFLPSPLIFSWTVDNAGKKHFSAQGTMYTYVNKASRDAGMEPVQMDQVTIPADGSSDGVFAVFFDHAKAEFPDATRG